MSSSELFSNQMQDLTANYLTGAFTKLWETWGEMNIAPSYDKFYYLTKGTYYIQLTGRNMPENRVSFSCCRIHHYKLTMLI